jgi:type II secretory pathway component PulF
LSSAWRFFCPSEYGQTLTVFRIPAPAWYDVASRVRSAMVSQEGKIVGVVAAGLAALWFISRRGAELTATFISSLAGGRRATRDLRLAAASRTLALLLESDVELPTALRLTSGLVLDSRTQRSMESLAGLTNDGRPLAETANELKSLPPLWRAIFSAKCSAADTIENLDQAADLYGGRAAVRADAMMRFLPTLLVCLIGGSITALYASAVFVPLSQLWQGLGGAE